MKYFFALGTNKSLSIAEIISVIDNYNSIELVNNSILVMEIDREIDVEKMIRRLGGTIKIGVFESESTPMYSAAMQKKIESILKPKEEGKFKFGISNYAKFSSPQKNKRLAMEIKKHLKSRETSCRWVTGKEQILSSVIVEQNLIKNGAEIVIVGDYKKAYVGRTIAVQAFKELSKRDYGRPSRDDHSGMLPPKLAQILINLSGAKKDSVLLDPFCGSGTVVTEAMLMGLDNIIGSDKSAKAVADTKENVHWFKENFDTKSKVKVFECDARAIDRKLDKDSVDCMAMEPYLGPQRGQVDQKSLQRELGSLYSAAIKSIYAVTKKGGRVVMVWPVRIQKEKNIFLSPDLDGFRRVNILDDDLKKQTSKNFSHRGNILYGREGQRVFREIIILEK